MGGMIGMIWSWTPAANMRYISKLRQNFFPLARAEKRGEKVKKGEKVESKKV